MTAWFKQAKERAQERLRNFSLQGIQVAVSLKLRKLIINMISNYVAVSVNTLKGWTEVVWCKRDHIDSLSMVCQITIDYIDG